MTFVPPSGDSATRSWLTLLLLALAMAVSFLDRYALAMLVQPIKADLALSDSAIGLLTGIAFSAFYATMGLVLARYADRGAHRAVIIGSLFAWSLMTALCGAAQQFWHLLLTRFGVGAGEAGVAPASHAIIATLFPERCRSTALAIFSAAGPLGIMIAFAVSGFLEGRFGWRWTFVILSLPGLMLGLLFLALGKRLMAAAHHPMMEGRRSWPKDIRLLLANARYRHVVLCVAMLALLTFGQTQWLPAYIERNFVLPRNEVGAMLAMTQGFGMLVGTLAGGPLFDAIAAHGERWRGRMLLACLAGGIPLVLGVYSVHNVSTATVLAGVAAFILALPSGELWSQAQGAVSSHQRATAAAITMMMAAIVGLGCGPLLIGWLSDLLAPTFGLQSLGHALLIVIGLGSVAISVPALLLVRAMVKEA